MKDIQKLPASEVRIETGSVQFGDDWPGIFIRGDNAGYYALILKTVLEHPDMRNDPIIRMTLIGLQKLLTGCIVTPAGEMLRLNQPPTNEQ